MQIFLTIAYIFIFIFCIRKLPFYHAAGLPQWIPSAIFAIKVTAGILLGLLYTYHYTDTKTTDTFKFFNDSKIMFRALHERPYDFFRMFTGIGANAPDLRHYYLEMEAWLNTNMLFNDNKTIIRLNAFFCLFSLGNYYVHVVFLNFLSFTGLMCLYKMFSSEQSGRKTELILFTFLFPSALFWGSGLLKDGLLIFVLGVFLYNLQKYVSGDKKIKRVILTALSLALLFYTKLYIIAVLLPGLFAWIAGNKPGTKKIAVTFGISYLIFLIAGFNIHYIFPKYDLAAMMYWKQWNFYGFATSISSKSLIHIPPLDMTARSVILNSPVAFFTTFFRPLPGDIHGNPLILLSVAENIFIVLLTLITIACFKRNLKLNSGLTMLSIFFVVFLFILIGLITPVLGAIVRYKIPALPFLGFVFVCLTDKEKLIRRIPALSGIIKRAEK